MSTKDKFELLVVKTILIIPSLLATNKNCFETQPSTCLTVSSGILSWNNLKTTTLDHFFYLIIHGGVSGSVFKKNACNVFNNLFTTFPTLNLRGDVHKWLHSPFSYCLFTVFFFFFMFYFSPAAQLCKPQSLPAGLFIIA